MKRKEFIYSKRDNGDIINLIIDEKEYFIPYCHLIEKEKNSPIYSMGNPIPVLYVKEKSIYTGSLLLNHKIAIPTSPFNLNIKTKTEDIIIRNCYAAEAKPINFCDYIIFQYETRLTTSRTVEEKIKLDKYSKENGDKIIVNNNNENKRFTINTLFTKEIEREDGSFIFKGRWEQHVKSWIPQESFNIEIQRFRETIFLEDCEITKHYDTPNDQVLINFSYNTRVGLVKKLFEKRRK